MDCEAASAYLLIKKITTATMTRYTNSGLVYSFIWASTQHNELWEIQLFHLSLILSRFSSMIAGSTQLAVRLRESSIVAALSTGILNSLKEASEQRSCCNQRATIHQKENV